MVTITVGYGSELSVLIGQRRILPLQPWTELHNLQELQLKLLISCFVSQLSVLVFDPWKYKSFQTKVMEF